MKKRVDARLKATTDCIELEAFGLTAGMDRTRPVLLFRERDGDAVLPVWLSPLDAEIALTQSGSQRLSSSPFTVPLATLDQLGVRLETCHFQELTGHQQYVELGFSGSRKLKSMRVRADHAMLFCLQAKAKFYCTRDFLQRCRDVEAELSQAHVGLNSGATKGQSYYLN